MASADAATFRLLVAALALLFAFAGAAPAQADHRPWDDGGEEQTVEDPNWGDEGWDEEVPVPAVEAPPLPEPAPIPEPWQPPAPAPLPLPVEPVVPAVPVPKAKIIKGTRALVRADGKAAIPRGAPKRVRVAIAAANQIIGKPYKWGGGHARLVDRGYDCSGTVGYSLVHAGLMRGVMVSGQMARWGSAGDGRWITVYANKGHVYMEIAGLRLDTSPVADPSGGKGPRWRPVIGRRPGFKARHPLGL
jgi:cell wall-associated NlpC family hydrolase